MVITTPIFSFHQGVISNLVVDFHRNRATIRNNKSLAGKHISTVVLVMVNNVTAERIDGFRSIENRIKPAKVMLGFLNACFICLISNSL